MMYNPTKLCESRILGSLHTFVVNLLERLKVKNMASQLETFADKFLQLNSISHAVKGFIRKPCMNISIKSCSLCSLFLDLELR